MGQYYQPIVLAPKKEGDTTPDQELVLAVLPFSRGEGTKLMEHSYQGYATVHKMEHLVAPDGPYHKHRIVWAGDYADREPSFDKNLYHVVCDREDLLSHGPMNFFPYKFQFIVNHTKKEYVDKRKMTEVDYGYKLHPLPLLTCEGNGRGGGDFESKDPRIGSWARDSISAEQERPGEDYKELEFDPKEDRRQF